MHVFITDDARTDLGAIWTFLARSSIDAADRVSEELIARAIANWRGAFRARSDAGA